MLPTEIQESGERTTNKKQDSVTILSFDWESMTSGKAVDQIGADV